MENNVVCGKCPYYSGREIHGHGESFGYCRLLVKLQDIFHCRKLVPKNTSCLFDLAVVETSQCLFLEVYSYKPSKKVVTFYDF